MLAIKMSITMWCEFMRMFNIRFWKFEVQEYLTGYFFLRFYSFLRPDHLISFNNFHPTKFGFRSFGV